MNKTTECNPMTKSVNIKLDSKAGKYLTPKKVLFGAEVDTNVSKVSGKAGQFINEFRALEQKIIDNSARAKPKFDKMELSNLSKETLIQIINDLQSKLDTKTKKELIIHIPPHNYTPTSNNLYIYLIFHLDTYSFLFCKFCIFNI